MKQKFIPLGKKKESIHVCTVGETLMSPLEFNIFLLYRDWLPYIVRQTAIAMFAMLPLFVCMADIFFCIDILEVILRGVISTKRNSKIIIEFYLSLFTYFPFSIDGLLRDSLYMMKYWLAYSVFSFPSDPCTVISG